MESIDNLRVEKCENILTEFPSAEKHMLTLFTFQIVLNVRKIYLSNARAMCQEKTAAEIRKNEKIVKIFF